MADVHSHAARISSEIAQNDTQRARTTLAEAYIDLSPKDFRALVDEMEKNESKNKIDIKASFSGKGTTVETAGPHATVLLKSTLPNSYPASKTEKFAELLRPQDHTGNELATRALMNLAFRMPPEQGREFLKSASDYSLSKSEPDNNIPYLKVSFVDINKDGKPDNLGRVDVHTPPTRMPGVSIRQPGGAFLGALLDGSGIVGTGSTTMFEYDFSSGTKWPPYNHKPEAKAQTYNDLRAKQQSKPFR